MKTINGEDYFEVKDLAEFWGYPTFHSLASIIVNATRSGYGPPRPDINGTPGSPKLWKKSRLGELNMWHNEYRRTRRVRMELHR